MKLCRMISTFILITILAVGYVYQRVEIIQAGYGVQKNRRYLGYLVEQNSELMYDLSKLESPRYLLASVGDEEMEFSNRRSRENNSNNFTVATSPEIDENEGLFGRFIDLFTVNAEASSDPSRN